MTRPPSAAVAAALLFVTSIPVEAHCVRQAWMITQNVCVYCDHARAFFNRNGISVPEYNIQDRTVFHWNVGNLSFGTPYAFAQNRYGWITTPIIEIDGVVIRGFLPQALQKETCSNN